MLLVYHGNYNNDLPFILEQRGEIPTVCVDKSFHFFSSIASSPRSSSGTNITMECHCKFYDGDFWYNVKGNKDQRLGVSSARIRLVCFTAPERF